MSQSLVWNRKDLIDVEPLSRGEIETIFSAATAFKKAMEVDDKKQPYLEGRTVVNLSSNRARGLALHSKSQPAVSAQIRSR